MTAGRTIRDLYEQCMAPVGNAVTSYVSTSHLLALLGINPDMPVETLRRQLDWGQVAVRDDDEWEPLHIILRSPTGSRMAASPMSDNTDSPGAS